MFGLEKLFGGWGTSVSQKTPDVDLSKEGFSPQYAASRATEIRRSLLELKSHGRVISESRADQHTPTIPQLIDRTCSSLGGFFDGGSGGSSMGGDGSGW